MHMKTDEMMFLLLRWIWTSLMFCLLIAVYLCSPCFYVKVTVSLSLFPLCLSICGSAPSQLFIFLSDKDEVWKYDDAVACFLSFWHKCTQMPYFDFHLLHSLPLLFVSMVCNTPPFSSHFPSGFGLLWVDWSLCWCNSVVSRSVPPNPSPIRHHDHPPPSPFACLPPPITQFVCTKGILKAGANANTCFCIF